MFVRAKYCAPQCGLPGADPGVYPGMKVKGARNDLPIAIANSLIAA